MKRFSFAAAAALSLVALLAGCRGETVKKVTPRLAVTPVALSFGDVKVGTTGELSLGLVSQSNATVTITGVTLDDGQGGPAPEGFTLGEVADSVPGLGEVDLPVRFTPTSTGAKTARIVVSSDDDEHPSIEVTLDANGTQPALVVAPRCEAAMNCRATVVEAPPSIDFGKEPFARQIPLPSSELPILALRNDGDAELVITGLSIGGADAAAFKFEGNSTVPPGGLKVAPKQSLDVSLRFTPLNETQLDYAATVTVQSDDPSKPSVTVALSGQLGPNGPPVVCANVARVENPEEPVADYDTPTEWSTLLTPPAQGYDFRMSRDIRPRAKVVLSALSSDDVRTCTSDPEDGRLGLTWQWTLTKVPPGASGMGLSGANTPVATLLPQGTVTSGDYEATLSVSDAQGHTTTTTLTFSVALKNDLAIELSWNQPPAAYAKVDLDLHLVRPSSTPFSWFEEGASQKTSGDVHGLSYALYLAGQAQGLNFDWGDPGAADDPKLNLDDTGNGQLVELASLNHPGRDATCIGGECRYGIYVHYFEDGRAHTSPPTCVVDGVTCKDGDPCTCPGTGERCVANKAPAGSAPTGTGRCLVAPEPVLRVFVQGNAIPLAVLPMSGALRIGAPCQLLHVADVVWPGDMASNPQPPRVEPATDLTRYGTRSDLSLSCSPNVIKGTSTQLNWYGPEPR